MLSPKVMAAILAAVNAYIDDEQAGPERPRPSRWGREGRLAATRAHLLWSQRNRRWG